jgi:hypothetical protein
MKHKSNSKLILGVLAIIPVLLSGCGTMELGILTPEAVDAGLGIPEGVIIAREVALDFLRENYGELVPPEGTQWQGDYIQASDPLGVGTYQYNSSPWVMTIEYPVVEPGSTVYRIDLINADTDFQWEGQVDARGEVTEIKPVVQVMTVTAWLGSISTLPEGSGRGFYFSLSPEGAGEFELSAADEAILATIAEVADAEGTSEFVHVWGSLTCGVEAYGGCRLDVDRLRYGTTVTEPEPVEAWEGVIFSRNQPPGSGGDDYFVLTGRFPVEYGIWSQDENLLPELEALRDTGTVIRIWGELVAGIPDWAGTQIRVQRFERVEPEGTDIPVQPTQASDDRGWETYVNERYGYEIQYPPEANLEEMGIHGYVTDEQGKPLGDIPEGLEPDEIFEYLRQTYGENLCVQITYALGYITISVPENVEFRYATCGRTGVGAGDMLPKEEAVQIDGAEITAEGFEFRSGGESLAQHNETFVLLLPDGTRVEYSSRPSADATYQDYLMKTKPVLMEILSTYRSR